MEVVAHRIGVGELLEIGHIALLDIVEAHRRGALFIRKIHRPRLAIAAGADRLFDPDEQVVAATLRGAAVELLPHLVKPMHGAFGVVVVAYAGGQLVGTRLHAVDVFTVVRDPYVWLADERGRNRAGSQIFVITRRQPVLVCNGFLDCRERRLPILISAAGQWRRQGLVLALAGWTQLKGRRVLCLKLSNARIVGTRRTVGVDDALRQQIQHRLTLVDRLIGREQMIEAAVLANNNDDVLDRRRRIAVVAATWIGGRSGSYWCNGIYGHCPERHAAEELIPPLSSAPQSSSRRFRSHFSRPR
jgi:hypothetical protein